MDSLVTDTVANVCLFLLKLDLVFDLELAGEFRLAGVRRFPKIGSALLAASD